MLGQEPLLGAWQVMAINGRELDQAHHPIYLLNGRSGGEAQSQCLPFAFNWPGHARQLSASKQPGSGPVQPICARGWTPQEEALGPALATARRFVLKGSSRVLASGEKGQLVLARPADPILNPAQNVPSPSPTQMWGEWRVEALNGRAPSSPMTLLFFRQRLELISGCVAIGRLVEQLGSDFTMTPDAGVLTTCERMTSPDEQAAERILAGTLRLMEAGPRRRTLAGRGGSITLTR